MEELRSTEILDREIQEDARRKADKILKSADSDCIAIAREGVERFEKISLQKKAEYERRIAEYRKDAEAAIPLEKRRHLISYIDTSVKEALDQWFAAAGADKKLSLLGGLLDKYAPALEGKTLDVCFRGYTERDVSRLVSNRLKNVVVRSLKELSETEAASRGLDDGFFIQTDDGFVFCRVTCGELREELLQEYREDLAVTLLGADVFSAADSTRKNGAST